MNIIQGRGKNRSVIALPHGSVFRSAAKSDSKDERQQCQQFIGEICNLIGIGGASKKPIV